MEARFVSASCVQDSGYGIWFTSTPRKPCDGVQMERTPPTWPTGVAERHIGATGEGHRWRPRPELACRSRMEKAFNHLNACAARLRRACQSREACYACGLFDGIAPAAGEYRCAPASICQESRPDVIGGMIRTWVTLCPRTWVGRLRSVGVAWRHARSRKRLWSGILQCGLVERL